MEDVWEYPRPPALQKTTHKIKITTDNPQNLMIAHTRDAYRVLETSHPPTYYLPPESITPGTLRASPGGNTMCEWKVILWGCTCLPQSNTHTTGQSHVL